MSNPSDFRSVLDAVNEGDLDGAREAARAVRHQRGPQPRKPVRASFVDERLDAPSATASVALTRLPGGTLLNDVQLPVASRKVLDQLVREQLKEKVLAEHGLLPRRRILFVGPPGVGKSMTALALANELRWPAYVVRIDTLVGSFLGQTATRVRELFQFSSQTRAVILVDEIDAIARRRGATSDVGEIDRVVVTLLQELEHSHPAGLFIATSNLPEHLDDALWRRFELVVRFPSPTRPRLEAFARTEARRHDLSPLRLSKAMKGAKNFSDVARIVADAHREQVLGQ